ncbi:hypothetical protein [Microbacterium sp.]|uniref:hypothetical protein n=1 Tax=Microbacterium sp. TaxID=51671 RepID=UPI002FE14CAF
MDDSGTDSEKTRRIYGPPRAAVLAFGTPEPAIAYAVPLAGAVIVVATIVMTVFAGDLVIANSEVAALRGGPDVLAGVVILAVAVAVAHGFGITAATLAVIARVDGRRLTAGAAWAGAVRRPGSVLLATLVTLGIAALVVGIVGVLIPVLPIAGIAAAIALLPLGIVLAPLLLAWPLIVAGTHSLPSALAAAWRSPRAFQGQAAEPLGSPRLAVSVAVIITGLISVGLGWSGGLLPAGWWTPVVGVALALVPAALTQLLLVAVEVRGMALRVKGPLQVVENTSADPAETAEPVRAPRGGVLIGLGVLLVPAIVAGVLIAINPWHVPAYAAADVRRVWKSSEVVHWDGGTAVLSRLAGEDSRAQLCSGAECGPEHEMRSILPSTIAPAADGGLLSAAWNPVEGADSSSGSFELRVTHSSPEALARWSEPLDDDASDAERWEAWHGFPGEERVLGSVDAAFRPAESVTARINESRMAVAIDSSGENPVIASIVRPELRDSMLSVDFCDDAECTASSRISMPVQWSLWSTNATTLDIASAPDGSVVITLVDDIGEEGAIPLRVITATADGEWTTETPDVDVPGESVTDLDATHGAQVAMNADGLPVILFRGVEQNVMRLFTCADASCADVTFTDITPDTELLHAPALAIDATGRPLIGTIDAAVNIALLSCDDAACTSRTSVPLAGVVATGAGFTNGFALSLDDQDRPLAAVGLRHSGATAKDTDSGTVIECTAARCGAD